MNAEDADHHYLQSLIHVYEKKLGTLDVEATRARLAICKHNNDLAAAERTNNEIKEKLRQTREKLKQLRGFEKINLAQSRWGFHPCHYEHYLKLKFLYKKLWKAVYQLAEFERWVRKEPQNRVTRQTLRDQDGRKIGSKIIGARPAPPLCPVFTYKSKKRADFGYLEMPTNTGSIAREYLAPQHWRYRALSPYLWIYDPGIIADFQNARTPIKDLTNLTPLILTAEEVDHLCAFFIDNPFAKHKPPPMHPIDVIAYMVKNLPMTDPEEEAALDRKLNATQDIGEVKKITRRITDEELMGCVAGGDED